MEADSQRREELLSTRDQIRGTLDGARQTARQDKDRAHQVAMRHQSLDTQVNAMRESIERTDRQVAQLRERQESLTQALRENEDPLAGLQAELEQQLELRLQVERRARRPPENWWPRWSISCARQSSSGRPLSSGQRDVADELESAAHGQPDIACAAETIRKQLDESKHVLEDVLQPMPEGANEPEWQRSLERVANRIARLGPINLAAIDEYNLQSERKNYLDAQNEDLVTALDTLESAIRKIDKETRNRFRETFEKVN